jgi:hypothetical protein
MAEYGGAQFDRRQYPRLDFTIPFAFDVSEQKLPDGITANISLGGLLVYLPYEVTKGQVLELTMRLPEGEVEQSFKARAEVMWVESGDFEGGWVSQAGLRFFEMSPRSFGVWKAFLDQWYKK